MFWFVFISNNILLHKSGDGIFRIPESDAPVVPLKPWTTVQELPDMEGKPCRAFQLQSPPAEGLPADIVTMELRTAGSVLTPAFYNMAGKASELLYWDSNTRFCGHCGAPMKRHTDISKRCTNCGKEVWPQVSPAIIVRIRKCSVLDADGTEREPEKILLVHARNFRRSDYYGLVAGFVETGETLEQCVEREVWEETRLRIANLRYFGSQPWPYPCGIMIGFTADYAGGDLQLQDEELTRGGWFTRDNLPHIPDRLSIARSLIDHWTSHP